MQFIFVYRTADIYLCAIFPRESRDISCSVYKSEWIVVSPPPLAKIYAIKFFKAPWLYTFCIIPDSGPNRPATPDFRRWQTERKNMKKT